MNVLSLFAGIGGLELGLERSGMEVVGQVELDEYCRRILHAHWPNTPQHNDVRTTAEWWTSQPRPHVDLICAGFPCQPFSQAGLQKGIHDERWGWPWTLNVIRALQPRYILLENVSRLVRDRDAFGEILSDLHVLRFNAQWATVRASDFGAPHRRERVFIVAYPQINDVQDPNQPATEGPLQHQPGRSSRSARRPDWLPEPNMDRVAHGIPRRLVQPALHALGNAVVPAVSEHFGRLIINYDRSVQ
ncbi:DNA (cytosine-5-)-methyltransferase [Rhodococcus sp. RS1C4]|nr:DNA (cytosine-5-)-methyltransferase [Rhodococcus sp. RS1C4]